MVSQEESISSLYKFFVEHEILEQPFTYEDMQGVFHRSRNSLDKYVNQMWNWFLIKNGDNTFTCQGLAKYPESYFICAHQREQAKYFTHFAETLARASHKTKDTQEITEAQITNIATADPANIQEVAAGQLGVSIRYYESALKQSERSFVSALIWASIGTLLIIAAVVFLLIRETSNLSYISLIGGAVVEAIAGLNFYLYGHASKQLTQFQVPLDRVGRFLLANSICENIEGDLKQQSRAKLVEVISNSQEIHCKG